MNWKAFFARERFNTRRPCPMAAHRCELNPTMSRFTYHCGMFKISETELWALNWLRVVGVRIRLDWPVHPNEPMWRVGEKAVASGFWTSAQKVIDTCNSVFLPPSPLGKLWVPVEYPRPYSGCPR